MAESAISHGGICKVHGTGFVVMSDRPLPADSSGGLQSSFSLVCPKSAVCQVIEMVLEKEMLTVGELACSYAVMILEDEAAGVEIESYWPMLFAKMACKCNVTDLIMNVGTGGGGGAPVSAAAPADEEKKKLQE